MLPGPFVDAATNVSVGNAAGVPGTTATVSVNLTSDTPVTAVQFDLLYDATKLTSGPALGGNALTGHEVASSEPATGTRRVVLYSLASAPLKNGALVNVPFTIPANAIEEVVGLSLTNVVLANAAGNAVTPVASTAGSLTISFTAPARFDAVTRAVDGRVQFQLIGTPGRSYVIQTSPDLAAWSNLSTNALPAGGFVNYSDSTATNAPRRFYRAVAAP